MKNLKKYKYFLIVNLVLSFTYAIFYSHLSRSQSIKENIYTKFHNKLSSEYVINLFNIEITSIQKGLGEPCSNRKVWKNQIISNDTKNKAFYFNNNPLPIWKDSIYFEWNNSRIRVNSDDMLRNRIRPLRELVEVECIEYNGKYVKKIEEYLVEIARQASWVIKLSF